MSPISPDADGQQTEWCVHYKRVGKRGTDQGVLPPGIDCSTLRRPSRSPR
jgi:hypothetical protein